MTVMAAACGILIVILGLSSTVLSSSRAPSDGEFAIQVICLVGGLILCFLSVVLSRLTALSKRLEAFETPGEYEHPVEYEPEPPFESAVEPGE